MNEALKKRYQAAMDLATETLQRMDMGGKSAQISAAKYQGRVEAFRQALEWMVEEENKLGN